MNRNEKAEEMCPRGLHWIKDGGCDYCSHDYGCPGLEWPPDCGKEVE